MKHNFKWLRKNLFEKMLKKCEYFLKNSNEISNRYFCKMTKIHVAITNGWVAILWRLSESDSALPSYAEAIKLPSDYIKCPNDTYRLFTATRSDSPTPWTITEMVTTPPGTPSHRPPPPPSGRNRVHPHTIIRIDHEEEDSADECEFRLWILLISLCILGCLGLTLFFYLV